MGRFISRDPLGYVDGMSLYNGYFSSGFGLDPMGTEKHIAIPKAKGGQPGQGLFVFTPNKPNENVCSNPREVILVAGTRNDTAMKIFGIRFEKKLKEEGNGSVKDVSELTSKLSGGNIKYLLLNAHGNERGKIQLNKGYINITNSFKRKDFCCKCIIWLQTCYTANYKTPQAIADSTGCKVFACNRVCRSDKAGHDLGKTFNALIKKSNKEHEQDPNSDDDFDWNPDPKTKPVKVKQGN